MTPAERDAILGALPDGALAERYAGGVASLIVAHDGALVDGAVGLGPEPEVWRRPLPHSDPAQLQRWLEMIERRRGQLAHDLSGPATGVMAALETVLEFEPIPDSSRRLLTEARSGMLRLTRLLDDRSGLVNARSNAVAAPLVSLVEHWCQNLREAYDPDHERFQTRVVASLSEARVDATLAQGALSVMFANAWKFRKGQRAELEVRAEQLGGRLHLEVTDDGRGIDSDTCRQAGELGFSGRANGVGCGLFLLRWASRGPSPGVVIIAPSPNGGTRTAMFLPMNNITPPRGQVFG
ncbi:MAG: ATP-binding protein [Myxococcota bacterium]|nr:ATP-binding protein [Myxococcota bacterium]